MVTALQRGQSLNRAQKVFKKTSEYKPIPLPHLLSDSHLPFLHEGFLHDEFPSSPAA